MTIQPLAFRPDFEQPAPDEAETFREMIAAMRSISETTAKDYGEAVRSVHAKGHALLEGEMRVLDGLPAAFAQGIFGAPATYRTYLRFSTNPGDILDDSVSTPRGLAIKVVGVDGERLPGSEGATTQDFVMQNAPAFSAATPKAFLGTLKLLAKTTDTPQVLKKAISLGLRGAEAAVEAVRGPSGTLRSLGGHPATHILGETFYTMVPFLYGPYVAKLSVAPASPELRAHTDEKLAVAGHPDALRDAAAAHFAEAGGTWDVRIQLCTDLETMPIEDASVPWPEDRSPFITVARITAPPQDSWSDACKREIDEAMSFSPWHGITAHRPLGGIMRSRKPAYEMSAGFRSEHNRCPIHEPVADVG